MMRLVVFLILALAAFPAGAAHAGLDAVRLALEREYATPLHWVAVHAEPQWACGVRPQSPGCDGRAVAGLDAGLFVVARVPGGAWLRVMVENGARRSDVAIELDQGSGLRVTVPTVPGSDGRSLLLPPSREPVLARVTALRPLDVSLFISRRGTLGDIAPYRFPVEAAGDAAEVRRDGDMDFAQRFYRLEPGVPLELSGQVAGPARLAVEVLPVMEQATLPRFAPYRVFVSVDGGPSSIMEMETSPDRVGLASVDRLYPVLGKMGRGYVDLDRGGHRVAFSSAVPLLVRVLGRHDPDYLLPGLNAPDPSPETIQERLPPVLKRSAWDVSVAEVQDLAARERPSPALAEQAADMLVRDNSRLEGGLVGPALLARSALDGEPRPRVLEAARTLLGRHSGFRALSPVTVPPGPRFFAWYALPLMLEAEEPRQDLNAAPRDLDRLLAALPGGMFFPVPAKRSDALRYALPERGAPSALRLAVVRPPADARLWVSLDEGEPMAVLAASSRPLGPEQYRPGLGETGLALLERTFPDLGGDTLDGPFSRFRDPAPMVDAAVTELHLPADTKMVRVWGEPDGPKLAASLSFRDGNVYRLPEAATLGALDTLPAGVSPWRLFTTLAAGGMEAVRDVVRDHPDPQRLAALDLANGWIPLVRRITSLAEGFLASTGQAPGFRPIAGATPPAPEQCRKWEAAGELVRALEGYALLARNGSGAQALSARLSVARVLRALGEVFLAETVLRGMILSPELPGEEGAATRALERMYSEDPVALERLLAAKLLRRSGRGGEALDSGARLASHFLEQGAHREALELSLALDPDHRPEEVLLRAALAQGWSVLADREIQTLASDDRRALWTGVAAMERGDFPGASMWLRRAGDLGASLSRSMDEGLALARKLRSPDERERSEALEAWPLWWAARPGPRVWRGIDGLVRDSAGTAQVHSVPRAVRMVMNLAREGRPASARLVGPARIRVTARPVHSDAAPMDGTLVLRVGDATSRTPVVGNRPSPGLEIIGAEASLPGRAERMYADIPAGVHAVSIEPEGFQVLVDIHVSSPSYALPVLPRPTPQTLAWAEAGKAGGGAWGGEAEGAEQDLAGPRLYFLRADGQKPDPGPLLSDMVRENARSWSPPGGWSRRMGSGEPRSAPGDSASKEAAPGRVLPRELPGKPDRTLCLQAGSFRGRENARKLARSLEDKGFSPIVAVMRDPRDRAWNQVLLCGLDQSSARDAARSLGSVIGFDPPRVVMNATLVARRTIYPESGGAEVGTTQVKGEPELAGSPRERLLSLLALVRDDPDKAVWADATAREILAEHPQTPDGAALVARIGRGLAWETLPMPASSAGVRFVPVSGWRPEARFLQVRKALSGVWPANEHVLYGPGGLSLELDLNKPSRVHLVLARSAPPYLDTGPMEVVWTLDGESGQGVELTDSKPRERVLVPVASGRHVIRLAVKSPRPNQFLRVRIEEYSAACDHVFCTNTSWGARTERAYHLATAFEPVEFDLGGPAWLRIVRHDPATDKDHVRYMRLARGEHTVTLAPPPGEPEALYRVAMRMPRPGGEAATDSEEPDDGSLVVFAPVPGPAIAETGPPPPTLAVIRDEFPPGSVGVGTWEARTGFYRRRDVDEDRDVGDQPEQFVQFSGVYRVRLDDLDSYSTTDVLTRVHEHGGPTVGLAQNWAWDVEDTPLTVRFLARGYAQNPDAETLGWFGDGRTEWSLYGRASVQARLDIAPAWHHVPRAALFGRALSMDRNTRYPSIKLDQDVFTDYKAEHMAGWSLSDTLYYRPWLDTMLFAGAGMSTNEDFNPFSPDNLRFRTGLRQLMGPVTAQAGYRYTHYFQDSDRSRDVGRDFVTLGLVWDHWFEDQQRLQLGFSGEYDLNRGDASVNCWISWLFSRGRGLSDFRPNDESFYSRKKLRVPYWRHNGVHLE